MQRHAGIKQGEQTMSNNNLSISRRWAAYRPSKGGWIWSCVGASVATMIVGFAWGGWVTGGSAKRMAEAVAASSRDQLVAAICVERFQAGGDAQAQLAALKLLQSYNRGSFIEKGGWAVMPDKSSASRSATSLCANQLVAL